MKPHVIGLLTALCAHLSLGATMNEGDTFAFTFSDMNPNTGFSPLGPILVALAFDRFDLGETIKLELYEDSLADAPWFAQTVTRDSASSATAVFFVSDETTPWLDLQGALKITLEHGTVDLQRVTVFRNIGPDKYVQSQSVPEPSTAGMCMCSIPVILWLLRRKNGLTQRCS